MNGVLSYRQSRGGSYYFSLCFRSVIIFWAILLLVSCGGGSSGDGVKIKAVAKAGADRIGAAARNFDQVDVGDTVFLNGTASTGSEWQWRVIEQSATGRTQLTSQNTQVTGFYAETAGIYTIQLTVGSDGSSSSDTVVVTLIDDQDWDGLDDANDPDLDGDGFANDDDAFPNRRQAHYDTDSDGTSNYDTADVDGDSVIDRLDAFPLNPTKSSAVSYTENKENGVSNQNDGISVSEDAGVAPATIDGKISAVDNRPDIDYYQITFNESGRYSVVLVGTK